MVSCSGQPCLCVSCDTSTDPEKEEEGTWLLELEWRISWPGDEDKIKKLQHSPELSHPGSQLEGSQVGRSCSGITRQLSKLKLEVLRFSLAKDEI